MMKPTQEQAVAWAKEVSGVEFPAGTAGVKIGMSPEHLESVATLAYEAGRKDENEACANVLDDMANDMAREMEPSTAIAYVRSKAAEIRVRGNK